MNGVIGDLLPSAIGIAVSPVPVIAVILMLLSPRAGRTSVGFMAGWVLGIVLVTGVLVAVIGGAAGDDEDSGSTVTGVILLFLGALLIAMALRQWHARPAAGSTASLPPWMSAIDSMTTVKALGLGFLLAAVNPKNLALAAAAAATIAGASLTTGDEVVALLVFTLLASSSVVVPVVAYALARERAARWLDELKVWLEQNNATVMAVVLLVIGVVMIGKGIGVL